MRIKKTKQGFTMIELLMVIMLVAILGAVALPQFLDFRREGKVAAAQSLQASINTGLKLQLQQARLRCGLVGETYTPMDALRLNDVTAGSAPLCSATQLPVTADRHIVDSPSLPVNPFNGLTTVGDCTTDTYVGWCYSVSTGTVLASTTTEPNAVSPLAFTCTLSGSHSVFAGTCTVAKGRVSFNVTPDSAECIGGNFSYTALADFTGSNIGAVQFGSGIPPIFATCH